MLLLAGNRIPLLCAVGWSGNAPWQTSVSLVPDAAGDGTPSPVLIG